MPSSDYDGFRVRPKEYQRSTSTDKTEEIVCYIADQENNYLTSCHPSEFSSWLVVELIGLNQRRQPLRL